MISVVVICHAAYSRFLGECLDSVDTQSVQPQKKILVCDGFTYEQRPGWLVLSGNWKSPNPARNLGVENVSTPWVTFVDGDNVMAQGYLQASLAKISTVDQRVGFVYATVQYTDADLNPTRILPVPEWDYWRLREITFVDTAACWRTDAIRAVGSFDVRCRFWDDYNLALRISAYGYTAAKQGAVPIFIRQHGPSRSERVLNDPNVVKDLWYCRSLAIVTLMAGRYAVLEQWYKYLKALVVPPETHLYVVDNSGNDVFRRRLSGMLFSLENMGKFRATTLVNAGTPYDIKPGEEYLKKERHQHVTNLYNRLFAGLREDLVMTLEDDVEPPADALEKLCALHLPWKKVGAVAGVYQSGTNPTHLCAALDKELWTNVPRWADFPKEIVEAGFTGGGCTVYSNAVLQKCLPLYVQNNKHGYFMGWDGNLCYDIRRQQHSVLLHGDVRCVHHAWGKVRCEPCERQKQK